MRCPIRNATGRNDIDNNASFQFQTNMQTRVARDNTVRYRRSTLQLLPGMERPTYAGVKVDVLTDVDGVPRFVQLLPLAFCHWYVIPDGASAVAVSVTASPELG